MGKWSRLTGSEKAAEFDSSHDSPREYAEKNFSGHVPRGVQYEQARSEQREQRENKN